MLVIVGLASDGSQLVAEPSLEEALALAYMAAVVTAGGFVAWYGSIERLGVERASLFSGVLPATALFTGALLGHAEVTPERVIGIVVVVAGITAGLLAARTPATPLSSQARERNPP